MTLKEIAQDVLDEDAWAAFVATEDKGTTPGAYKGWETRRHGVSQEKLSNAINRILDEGLIDVRVSSPEEREALIAAAKDFHAKYGSMRIPLPIGRELFFAPAEKTIERYGGDMELAWAEYAIHAATNDNTAKDGKHYRTFGSEKVNIVNPRIKEIVDADQTEISRGSVLYFLPIDKKHIARLVAKPEHNNLRVDDLTEVTATYTKGKVPSTAMPLARAVAEWTSRGDIPDSATDVG